MLIVGCLPPLVHADVPVASYIFPAGGQRGTAVNVRVGGLFLHKGCLFHTIGPGIVVTPKLTPIPTIWFEGPLLPLPDSQRQEDYPKDMAAQIKISPDAPLGTRYWQLTTSQGATAALKFVVGTLPEVVEDETQGDPIPVDVKLPVTINGRIFPRADVDVWAFNARQGQSIVCEVQASRLGSPLDARLELPWTRRASDSWRVNRRSAAIRASGSSSHATANIKFAFTTSISRGARPMSIA